MQKENQAKIPPKKEIIHVLNPSSLLKKHQSSNIINEVIIKKKEKKAAFKTHIINYTLLPLRTVIVH